MFKMSYQCPKYQLKMFHNVARGGVCRLNETLIPRNGCPVLFLPRHRSKSLNFPKCPQKWCRTMLASSSKCSMITVSGLSVVSRRSTLVTSLPCLWPDHQPGIDDDWDHDGDECNDDVDNDDEVDDEADRPEDGCWGEERPPWRRNWNSTFVHFFPSTYFSLYTPSLPPWATLPR